MQHSVGSSVGSLPTCRLQRSATFKPFGGLPKPKPGLPISVLKPTPPSSLPKQHLQQSTCSAAPGAFQLQLWRCPDQHPCKGDDFAGMGSISSNSCAQACRQR